MVEVINENILRCRAEFEAIHAYNDYTKIYANPNPPTISILIKSIIGIKLIKEVYSCYTGVSPNLLELADGAAGYIFYKVIVTVGYSGDGNNCIKDYEFYFSTISNAVEFRCITEMAWSLQKLSEEEQLKRIDKEIDTE